MRIQACGEHDVRAAAGVLGEAFRFDPPMLAAFTGHDDLREVMQALFEVQIRHQYMRDGCVDLAMEGDRVLGVALWARPGRWRLPLARELRFMPQVLRILGPSWRGALAAHRRIESMHPRLPHWYLYALGVAQPGKGVGGALIEHGTKRAGPQACYLEASTPNSARLYARHGFRPVALAPGCSPQTPVCAMWRPALWDEIPADLLAG
ncbi:GNAT family N-acetyltransferase [Gephyromycinifex aptenodytis]|uniref:GNAT family N-acetyltransferase n=1 Tax=Gephyromycinifex aptenodytis TaxID=2716227 RepID=UPI00144720BD|nr:GNAT family N-acetyltransferase [Gephyromycinifex aptenodytis]